MLLYYDVRNLTNTMPSLFILERYSHSNRPILKRDWTYDARWYLAGAAEELREGAAHTFSSLFGGDQQVRKEMRHLFPLPDKIGHGFCRKF